MRLRTNEAQAEKTRPARLCVLRQTETSGERRREWWRQQRLCLARCLANTRLVAAAAHVAYTRGDDEA